MTYKDRVYCKLENPQWVSVAGRTVAGQRGRPVWVDNGAQSTGTASAEGRLCTVTSDVSRTGRLTEEWFPI